MMYFLHHLSDRFIGFNVFLYVTFRAIAAAVTAFLLTLIFGNFIIRILIALKLGQPIRGAAEVHRLAELHGGKQGTPTMGGVLVIGSVFVSSLLWARLDNRFVWLVLFCMIYLGALGFADDYLKVTKKKSDGISGRIKLVFQIALALIVTAVFISSPLQELQGRSSNHQSLPTWAGLPSYFFSSSLLVPRMPSISPTGSMVWPLVAPSPWHLHMRYFLMQLEISGSPNIYRSRFIHLPGN
jgi:UDP-N-acetylmuramyl pentapeptide phosphotransferase/UDP-N-acetylglucosamine-1-phosphate transferase